MSEYLIFDGVTLDGPIECEDLGILRHVVTRHENLTMHGAVGTRPYAPIVDELARTLTWYVRGTPSVTDVPQDPVDGVTENLEFYRNLFTSPGAAITGEHDITLHLSDFVFTGGMQIVEYAQARTGPQTATILTAFVIADGELTATGS